MSAFSTRELSARLIRYAGIPALVRQLATRSRVTIVMYHDPTPEALESQLAYLTKRYRFMPLAPLVEAMHSGDWSQIPAHGLVVTIDDGHRGNRLLGRCLPQPDHGP